MAASKAAVKVEADSELMKNQKHAVLMGAQQNFQVLQTADGDAIFFSMGSDGVLYLTREVRASGSGWHRTDLSSSLRGSGKAKWFAASQNPATLAIDIAVAMSSNGHDSLHLSRNNLISGDGWENRVSWESVGFDDAHSPAPSRLVIAGLYMLTREGTGEEPGAMTWFVDIVKDPASKLRLLERYCIEPDSSPRWHKHTLPNDVEQGSVTSCLGRRQSDYMDGIYTMGKIGESESLIFTPAQNVWEPRSPPQSTVLGHPKGASGMSSCVTKGGLTNLFVAGDGGLYLFKPDGQGDGAEPLHVIPSSQTSKANTFAGAIRLQSSTVGAKTAVWGLNRQQDLVYATCRAGNEAEASSWSPPMRICSGVVQFAFYLGRTRPSNVLFALLRDQSMVQLVQDAATGIWAPRNMTLPTTDVSHMVEANTFTTHVKCTDQNGLPAVGTPIRIASTQAVPLVVNRGYYKIGPGSPIDIKSDGTGSVTVVQETDALLAVRLKLICGDQALEVDPQSKIAEKLSKVKSGHDLDVRIPTANGETKPLVPDDVPSANREQVARFLPKLLKARSRLQRESAPTSRLTRGTGQVELSGVTKHAGLLSLCQGQQAHATLSARFGPVAYAALTSSDFSTGGAFDCISTAAGDLFQFLKDAWGDVQSFWTRAVDSVTHFIAQIGNTVYTAILDTVEAVSSAVEFVFKQIKVFFEDLVAWLGFIFNWGDILRTHRVIKNMARQYARHAADQLDTLRDSLRDGFKELRGFIDGKSWDGANLPADDIGKIQQGDNNKVPGGESPQSNWAVHHTNNGLPSASSAITAGAAPGFGMSSSVGGLLDTLQEAVQKEEQVLRQAVQRIKGDIVDNISTISPVTVIQKVLGILGDVVADTAENVLLTLVDLLKSFVVGVVDLLDAPINIPIISPVYRWITGGDELSCLDITCLIAAIPATLVYKIVTDRVPFPDNDSTKSLIGASSFSELSSLLSGGSPEESSPVATASLAAADVSSGPSAKTAPSLAVTVVAVLKISNIAVSAIGSGLSYARREAHLSGPQITALSFALFIAAGGPTIAANFGPISKWTIVANVLLAIGLGKLCLDSSDKLNDDLKYYVMPWVSTLLGLVGLVVAIWARCEKTNAKTSDEIGLVAGIFSSVGKLLTAFTSSRMFPEAGALVFALSIGCAIAGGHFSAGSGVCVLNQA